MGVKKLGFVIIIAALLLCSCTQNAKQQGTPPVSDNYRTYYEVFLYSFYDSNGDGIGDINGLISKLDYVKDMGFNGIWLMPIMPSPSYHKYDVTDYYNIDPQYGTLDDFKNLISACNDKNINVIIDLVINHTSTEHTWFKTAVKNLDSTSNDYFGYYNFATEQTKKAGYHKVAGKDWFYEGKFWSGMPDLNLADEALRKELETVADFWLNLGVSGFRLDAAKEFYSGNDSKNIEVLTWFNNYCKTVKPDCYLVAEVWDSYPIYSKYLESGIDSVFNFDFGQPTGRIVATLTRKGVANSPKAFGEKLIATQKELLKYNPNAIDAPFFINHDMNRASDSLYFDENKIKTAWGMSLMMNGSAFVYYGEEIGMAGSGIDPNKRLPMFWSQTNKTGITKLPPEAENLPQPFKPVDQQQQDKNSILNYVKKAIAIRNENPEITHGIMEQIDANDQDLCIIKKTYNDSVVYVVYNVKDKEKTINLNDVNINGINLKDYLCATDSTPLLDGQNLILPPFSICVLK